MTFGIDWPSGFKRRRYLIIMVIYMYIATGQGQTTPLGQFVFINSIIQSI